uniref:terminase large subunit domain-containing protein n=1 Tax=Pseudonocardia sp. CA-138482 TaxID=3240023 RepID=UPI003F498593
MDAPTVEAPEQNLAQLHRLQQLRQRLAQVDRYLAVKVTGRPRPWHALARPDQRPPTEGDWLVYLALAGRGWGKSFAGANWLAEQAAAHPGTDWAVVAPVWRDCQTVCFEDQKSGLLKAFLPGELPPGPAGYNKSELTLKLTNGSRIMGFSADKPDRLRGKNLSGAWVDELAAMPHAEQLWDEALMPALRIGRYPRVFVTTTPRPVPMVRRLVDREDGTVIQVRGRTSDNAANLSARQLAELELRYAGTRIGRQELDGELLEDIEGALWTRTLLDRTRVAEAPALARVVVGVDPSVTSGENSDKTGIHVAGKGHDGDLYLLADYTLRATPHAAMSKAVHAFHVHRADRVIGEVNNGGDFIASVIRAVDEHIPYKSVTATRGKKVRAEPISALFEQGRAHVVGALPELEDQLCSWTPDSSESPDSLDAMVWAATELMTGASAMAYLSAITTICPACALPNPLGTGLCRSCGAELKPPYA